MDNIIATVSANPVSVLIDEKTYSQFFQSMKEEIDAFMPDLSTAKSRAEIAAMAYKVTRSKTAIDAAGKALNEEARAKINKVDEQRRKIREELDTLAEAVRKPLTDWEIAEKAKKEEAERVETQIGNLSHQAAEFTSEDYQSRLAELHNLPMDAKLLGEFFAGVDALRVHAIGIVSTYQQAAVKAECDAAELARLRAEAAEREASEAAKLEAERIEAAEREAYKQAVAKQAAQAELAKNRAAEREAEIAAQAKAEAERIADAAAKKIKDEHAVELAKIEAEKQKLQSDERERLAEVKRQQDAETARQEDRAHRGKIMGEAKAAIMTQGADAEVAKQIVLAIIANEIPNVRMFF